MCGEKRQTKNKAACCWGSPPRVRGKVYDKDGNLLNIGITPACAGKRVERPFESCSSEDHPRVCGEKSVSDFLEQFC